MRNASSIGCEMPNYQGAKCVLIRERWRRGCSTLPSDRRERWLCVMTPSHNPGPRRGPAMNNPRTQYVLTDLSEARGNRIRLTHSHRSLRSLGNVLQLRRASGASWCRVKCRRTQKTLRIKAIASPSQDTPSSVSEVPLNRIRPQQDANCLTIKVLNTS